MKLKQRKWLSPSRDYYGQQYVVYSNGTLRVLKVELSKTSQMVLAYDNNQRIKAQKESGDL